MILSLEDEEDQEELQDAGKIFFGNLNLGNKFKGLLFFSAQNVVTLDGEVMAVNGRVLSGHNDMSEYF